MARMPCPGERLPPPSWSTGRRSTHGLLTIGVRVRYAEALKKEWSAVRQDVRVVPWCIEGDWACIMGGPRGAIYIS
jgi:hypothetical protein